MADATLEEPFVRPQDEPDWPVEWEPVWGPKTGLVPTLEYAAMRVLSGTMGRLPEGLLNVALGGLARIAPHLDRRHADAARRFLDQALGPLDAADRERRVRQAYRHFFRVIVDGWRIDRRIPFDRTPDHFNVVLDDETRRLFSHEGGAVLVTGHLGNWEAGTALMPWLGFDVAYAIGKPVKNQPISQEVQRFREARRIRLLPRRGAMKSAAAIMRAGGALGMVLDQRSRQRPVLAPFFGRLARCDRSAGVLLRRLKVPIGIFACVYTDKPLHFRVETSEVLWPQDLEGADPAEIATRVNRALERLIRAYPDQYFWLHDRYRDTPETVDEGAASPAEDGLRTDEGLSSSDAGQEPVRNPE